jgi:PAS domain S-box-containing protein
MSQSLRVLLVEDNPDDAKMVLRELNRSGFDATLERVETEAAFLGSLDDKVDLVLSDYAMPEFDGMSALELLKKNGLEIPFIIVSGSIGEDIAVEAMRQGAADYLLKDRLARLGPAVHQALEKTRLRKERHQAQVDLRTTHAQLRQFLEHSPAVLYALKVEGQNVFPYLVNENITELLGFTVAEALQSEWWTGRLHSEDRDRAIAGVSKTFSQGTSHTEYRLRHKDGSYLWMEDKRRLICDSSNQPIEVVGIWADITERKNFERTLQETNVKLEMTTAAAEKANLAKSEFLSNMSHELRTPLNAILGFAQLMESGSPQPTASQTKSIGRILHSGWYLLELINEVLDLAAIDSGKMSLSKESVSLSEVLSEIQSMTELQAAARDIRMTFPRFADPVFVIADRIRLKQIVINLVSNAINYNKERGTVVVDCTVSDSGRIRLSVTDTGAGLTPEKLAQLFIPFNRLGQETSGIGGTGIGLVVSKRLAKLMGAVLGVESTVGVGSVFWCDLMSAKTPRLADQGTEPEILVQQKASADAPRHTLLYIEDNPANMELVQEIIARLPDIGFISAMDGTRGIEIARAILPSVILMDINLPGISGTEALKILREDPSTAHIPVLALSANAMPRDVANGLEAGFFRYLTKPIIIKEFIETLNTALALTGKKLVEPRNAKQMA